MWLFGPFLMGLAAEPASKRVLTFVFVKLYFGHEVWVGVQLFVVIALLCLSVSARCGTADCNPHCDSHCNFRSLVCSVSESRRGLPARCGDPVCGGAWFVCVCGKSVKDRDACHLAWHEVPCRTELPRGCEVPRRSRSVGSEACAARDPACL